MRGKDFCALLLTVWPGLSAAQRIPGRDLLEFPIGSLTEGPALSFLSADGFRNPASIVVPTGALARFAVSSLTTGADQGVAAQIVSAAIRVPQDVTLGISFARAAVDGIVRTDTDPQSLGSDVPYNTMVLSLAAAQRTAPHVTAGAAMRYQRGELDTERRAGIGLDAGIVLDSLFGADARFAFSSFLWRPGTKSGEGPAYSAAFDMLVYGRDSLGARVRTSYSFTLAPGISREHFVAGSVTYGPLEGRVGAGRAEVAGHTTTRPRFALGFRHGTYLVAVSREEGRNGLSPVYHFTVVAQVGK
jgi:hypothetical protein